MALPALQADYLFLAPALRERLAAQIPEVPVDVCETAERVLEADRRDMVLMVLWAGDVLGDAAAAGRNQLLRQRWLVILGLSNVSPALSARNTLAGPLLSRVHGAVAGWTPHGAARSFYRCPAATRPDITQGKALYPLCFEIELAL